MFTPVSLTARSP
ncbi:hypothetical protein YPPY25_3674, partial [Yersinia pestis PY-25]